MRETSRIINRIGGATLPCDPRLSSNVGFTLEAGFGNKLTESERMVTFSGYVTVTSQTPFVFTIVL
jgi:hypothetical protein